MINGGSYVKNLIPTLLIGVVVGVIILIFDYFELENIVLQMFILFIAIYCVLKIYEWRKKEK